VTQQPPQTPAAAGLQDALRLLDQLQSALQRRERAMQIDIIRRLLAMRPPLGDQWQALADVALGNGELGLARNAIDLFIEAKNAVPVAQYQKTMLLEQCGDVSKAYTLLCSLPEDMPDPVTNAYSRGVAALYLGETGEARRRLMRTVELAPRSGLAWLSLATSADLASEPALADHILAAEREMDCAAPLDRPPYFYAVGKVHAARGDPAHAFAAFQRGAEEMKAIVPYRADADRRNAAEAVNGYTSETIAVIAQEQPEPTNGTIFVMGLPRSGTTLVEQILTSHSEVSGGAEINRLLLLAQEIGGQSFAPLKRHIDAHGAAEPARLWRHWMEERFPAPGIVVDKSLTTSRLLGLAATLLPQAPLIWLTRDPLDCAWSCFRTFFVGSMPWSHDLEDMAEHFRIEDELLRKWQDILGERLLVVPYESLVADPRPWIRRILSHCSLAEEPQVFAPHESARMVKTASMMQVRQPITRTAIGSAKPYREFLEPFAKAYYR
jgi:tetratricopeptide (TPR) repeat protein